MGPLPQPVAAELVYILAPESEFQLIDALTGDPTNWDGQPDSDLAEASRKVSGHWAEGELQYLLTRGIIAPGQLNPDAAMSRSQAVTLLLHRSREARGRTIRPVVLPYADLPTSHGAYDAVRAAWLEGWLRPAPDEKAFRPDAPVTRAEFVVWAARALGLGELARSGLAVRSEYTDLAGLPAEQRNAAVFLQALGLLNPGAAFRGSDPMTQAEGAALTVRIYNYLVAR